MVANVQLLYPLFSLIRVKKGKAIVRAYFLSLESHQVITRHFDYVGLVMNGGKIWFAANARFCRRYMTLFRLIPSSRVMT